MDRLRRIEEMTNGRVQTLIGSKYNLAYNPATVRRP